MFAASGLVVDGQFSGTFDFGSAAASFPVQGALDGFARTLTGSFSFADNAQQYSATLHGDIATDGTVSGTWQTTSAGPMLEGSISGKTNNITFCGTWKNDAGRSGNIVLSRPMGDYCYFVPAPALMNGSFAGDFDVSQLSPTLGTQPVSATVDASARTISGPIDFHDGGNEYMGRFSGAIDMLGAFQGTWSAGPLAGGTLGITDGNTFCGYWKNNNARHGMLRLKRQ
jgi:hypothetical protein